MPSFERSRAIIQNKSPQSPYSYDKVLAFFNTRADPKDTSVATRANKITVAFTNHANFNDTITSMPSGDFSETAGSDLSALFMPFESHVNLPGSGLPGFMKGAEQTNLPKSDTITLANLLPFMWEPHKNNVVYDRWGSASGDGLNGLISSDRVYADINQYREVTAVRGIGLRLPLMGVGWGYTLTGAQALPSGTKDEIALYPSGDRPRVFKGGTTKGWQVDPSHYIAAPFDFRYDQTRHVWTCGGPGLPPGSGIYKVITLLDNENPGNAGWDYLRFPPIEPI